MLYHKDIGFPDSIKLPIGRYKLKYSNHANIAAATDKNGSFLDKLKYHEILDTEIAEVIEIETCNGRLSKILYRLPLTGSDSYDIILAVLPHCWVVKTVWLNHRYDRHKTLRKNKYAHPRQTKTDN